MILSFIEGSIISIEPVEIKTGDNPFRQIQFTENPEDKEMLLLSARDRDDNSDTKMDWNDFKELNDTNSDVNEDKEGTILEFRSTEHELINEVKVDLNSSDTETESSMTMNSSEMDAFRRKYDELMKQLEKERFERELKARGR